MVRLKIGVLAFQGDVSEHERIMEGACDGRATVVPVRKRGVIPQCQGLVLPGGESTTISRLLRSTSTGDELKEAVLSGVPVLATCAGLVLLSKEIEGNSKVSPLGLLDVTVRRNVFGSQRESFEVDLDVTGFQRPYRAVFIRAPGISWCGQGVKSLAQVGDLSVAVRQDNILGLAFHPELTKDTRFHELLLRMIEG